MNIHRQVKIWSRHIAAATVVICISTVGALANDVTEDAGRTKVSGPIKVEMDHAKVLRIDGTAHTVILGNPAIADAVVHNQNTLIITGRAFGSTNLVVLDRDSNPIADEVLVVTQSTATVVQIHRRGERFSHRCSPRCDSDMVPGDNKEFFEKNLKSAQARQELSKSNASPGSD